jgi:ribose/xylose/arabinose/galactoside ABC-type transport system permease subunit
MKLQGKSIRLQHEGILLLVLIAEWLFFAATGRNFITLDNTFNILRHSAEIGLLALAMSAVVLTGGIDLSVGSLLGLCAVLFGTFWRDAHLPVGAAILLTLGTGVAAGALNGTLVAWLKLPPLIVTLATFSLFRGLAEALTRGVDAFTDFPVSFLFLGQERWLGVPAQSPVFICFAIAIWLLVHRTTYGRSLRAIGFSPEGAYYAGIPVRRVLITAYVLTGLTAAMAAILYTARLGQAKADAGMGYELFAITSVVLGGVSIFGGVGSVHGALLGVAAIAVLNNGLAHVRQPREVAGMLTGLLLLVALSGSELMKRLANRSHGWQRSPSFTEKL